MKNFLMATFDEKLKALLKTEQSFLDKNWEFLEWKLQDSARNADEKLIKLLISDEEMRKKFFSEIAWYQVFNGNLFIEYISNKNFLDNSYTKYKNKIWLQINWKFLKESGEVSLVRPFKDCVLEWWQSKEDEKKKEIFFNEILAQDEIDKLFAPKVLTNFKKFDKDWEHKVEWFSRDENGMIKDNLIIKWNNLLALHTLKKEFEWQVKCIYIDVPYNTWNDSFWYNDNFNHSTWLTFMKNRLEIAKDFLKDDWVITVQCDDSEQAYLKILMDEIFSFNCINVIAINMSTVSWPKVAHAINWKCFPKTKEYVLMYAKNKDNVVLKIPKIHKEWRGGRYDRIIPEWTREDLNMLTDETKDIDYCNTKIKNYTIVSIKKFCEENNIEYTEDWFRKNAYRIFVVDPNSALFNQYKNIDTKTPLRFVKTAKWLNKLIITNFNRNAKATNIELASAELKSEIFISDNRTDVDMLTTSIHHEWWVVLQNWKKPEKLIQRIIGTVSNKWDIVLDYHLWSWTTCAVAHKMWRQYIWIEQLDYWENDSVVRLKNVIKWDTTGISQSVNRQWWWEFIYCELKKYNQEFIEQIENAKSTDELLKIREAMKEKAYFKYNFDMQKFEESLDEFKNEDIEKQRELLVEILNKNQLYVNLSNIDDENFEVSDEDKKLNSDFYSL